MTLSFASSNSALRHEPLVAARSQQCRLVDEVGEISTREARRATRDGLRIDVRRDRALAHVDLEDLLAARDVGVRHHDLAVEAARTQQRGIEHVRPVGGRDDDDAFVGLEAVHLDEQLVERLLALVVAAAETRAAVTADGVDFVDEDDARRVLLRLLEHVAHAGRTDTDEHFDEVEPEIVKNGTLASPATARAISVLPVPGGPTSSAPRGMRPPSRWNFCGSRRNSTISSRSAFGFVHARDVLERHAALPLGEQLRAALAEAHGASASRTASGA